MRFHVSFLKLREQLTQANFLIKNFGCTQHSSSKLDSVFTGTKFKYFEYLAAFGIAQASLALLLLARNFFSEEVFSSWHSKQASSARDLAKTFLGFCISFPRERPLLLLVSLTKLSFICVNLRDLRENRPFTCKENDISAGNPFVYYFD